VASTSDCWVWLHLLLFLIVVLQVRLLLLSSFTFFLLLFVFSNMFILALSVCLPPSVYIKSNIWILEGIDPTLNNRKIQIILALLQATVTALVLVISSLSQAFNVMSSIQTRQYKALALPVSLKAL
jgi:hypothetical protein